MKVSNIDATATRKITDGTRPDDQFVARWSPRALSGEPIERAELLTLIEAARWAPSCFNAQPWRFAYGIKGTDGFRDLLATLVDANQAWASEAGALIAIVSRSRYERNDNPAPTHSFDAGAAWMSIALQARSMGLITHGMQGFDQAAARTLLSLPEVYDLPAIIAVGYAGNIDDLSADNQAKEQSSLRKPLQEILFENNFEEMQS